MSNVPPGHVLPASVDMFSPELGSLKVEVVNNSTHRLDATVLVLIDHITIQVILSDSKAVIP